MTETIGFAATACSCVTSIALAAWHLSRRITQIEGKLDVGKQRMDDKDTHCNEQKETCHRRFDKLERIVDRLRNGRITQ